MDIKYNKIFFVGIGGISMSALAKILVHNGYNVSGSDVSVGEILKELEAEGIQVYIGHSANNVRGVDLLVYSSAINENNPEIVEAKRLGIEIRSRSWLLGEIAKLYQNVVAVSGSHGKTTTTALISSIFFNSNYNFTAHIGGVCNDFGSNNIIVGEKGYFVTEACEYKDNYLSLRPNIEVILNISLDHVDYFKNEQSLVLSFNNFSNNVKENGYLILNYDDKNCQNILSSTTKNKNIITFSLSSNDADYFVSDVKIQENGYKFCLNEKNGGFDYFDCPLFGKHNIYNVMVAIIVAKLCGLEKTAIKNSISMFKGVERRYEKFGKINGADVIFDYAHHPDEIRTTITETKEFVTGKLFVCFQPHTYSRTKEFWVGFVESLKLADNIILYPIYPAREKPINGVSSKRLASDLKRVKKNCYYAKSFDDLYEYFKLFVKKEDKILVLGAGDIIDFKNLLNV